MRLLILSLGAAILALTPQVSAQRGTNPEEAWRRDLIARHFPQQRIDRPGGPSGDAINAFREALNPEFDSIAASELFNFAQLYDPIWTGAEINKAALDQIIARMRVIKTLDGLYEWKGALQRIEGENVSNMWTLGIVADVRSLFPTGSPFDQTQSQRLLARFPALPITQVNRLSALLRISKARVAANLIQQDWLFNPSGFDEDRFRKAYDALWASTQAK